MYQVCTKFESLQNKFESTLNQYKISLNQLWTKFEPCLTQVWINTKQFWIKFDLWIKLWMLFELQFEYLSYFWIMLKNQIFWITKILTFDLLELILVMSMILVLCKNGVSLWGVFKGWTKGWISSKSSTKAESLLLRDKEVCPTIVETSLVGVRGGVVKHKGLRRGATMEALDGFFGLAIITPILAD